MSEDKFWTSDRRIEARKVFEKHNARDYKTAVDVLNARWGTRYSYDAIASAFRRHEMPRPLDCCGRDVVEKPRPTESVSDQSQTVKLSEAASRLRGFLTRKKESTWDECLDHLQTYPKRLDALLSELRAHNVHFLVSRESIVKPEAVTEQPEGVVPSSIIAPTQGGWYFALVVSDQHYCNKNCQEGMLQDIFGYATEDLKIKKVYGCGDWVDGIYRHGRFERSLNSVAEQYEYLAEHLPRKTGVQYEGIPGNHDLTFWEDSGLPVADFVMDLFAKKGRHDVTLYNAIKYNIRADGPVPGQGPIIQLLHPCIPGSKSPASKNAYALTYRMQKIVEGFTDMKPDVLLMGHFHQAVVAEIRSVWALQLACGLGPGSYYSQTFVGAPSLGAVVIGWQLSELGMIRRFFHLPLKYHSREKVHDQRNRMSSMPLDDILS